MRSGYNKRRRRLDPILKKKTVPYIDYKQVRLLQKYITPHGKMFGAKRTGFCNQNQRQLMVAIKRARFLGLLPYIGTTVKD
jgi:small subunit ribosomal protein S18